MSQKWEPATPFWGGYYRKPETAERLAWALKRALDAWPQLRMGQLIENMGLTDLFQIWDEDMIERLEKIADGLPPWQTLP